MKDDKINTIMFILCVIGYVYLFVYTLQDALELPIVQISNTTKECINVIDKKHRFSCDDLPIKYRKEWVK